MHAGASVIEVMPVHKRGCPCLMYEVLFTHPADNNVQYFRLDSSNQSRQAKSLRRGESFSADSYSHDHYLPWAALRRVLAHVVHLNGSHEKYAQWRAVNRSASKYFAHHWGPGASSSAPRDFKWLLSGGFAFEY